MGPISSRPLIYIIIGAMGTYLYLLFFALGPVYWLPFASPGQMQALKFFLFAAIILRLGWHWVNSGGRLSRTPVALLAFAIMAILFASLTHTAPIEDLKVLGAYLLPLMVLGVIPALSGASRAEIEDGIRGAPPVFACIAVLVPLGLIFPSLNWVNPYSAEIDDFVGSQTFTGFGGSRTGWSTGASFLGAVAFANLAITTATRRWLKLVTLLIIGAAIFIPGGRVGMAAFALMLALLTSLGALRRSTVRASIYWLLATILTVMIALVFAEELRLTALLSGSLSEGTTGRSEGWKYGWDIFTQNPIFGVGEYVADVVGRSAGYGAVHNTLLNSLVKFGVVGTLPLMLVFGWLFTRLYSRRRNAMSHYPTLIAALMFACIGAIVWFEPYAVFGAFFNVLLFWFAIGIFLSRQSDAASSADVPIEKARLRFVWH